MFETREIFVRIITSKLTIFTEDDIGARCKYV